MSKENPHNVRNFYIEVEIDGYKTTLRGGSPSKDGGMKVTLYQRDSGEITKALTVDCTADSEGVLKTKVTNNNGEYLTTVITAR